MSSTSLGTKRLFGKFLLVQVPVFAVAAIAALLLIAQFFVREERDALNARVGSMTARVGALLGSSPAASDPKLLGNYIGLLLADTAIMCAEYTDAGEAIASAPAKIGCRGQDGFHELKIPVRGGSGKRQLFIKFSDGELIAVKQTKRQLTWASLLFGLLIAGAASSLAFRIIVGLAHQDGDAAQCRWRSGRLCRGLRRCDRAGQRAAHGGLG